jgi:MOSC domain-containing protein YiiM
VTDIFIAKARGAPMQPVRTAELVARRGISGDRFFTDDDSQDRVVTLIESEAIAGAQREYQVPFTAQDCRRNIITSGIALNHLVGVEFSIGDVVLIGKKLCEPCAHLAALTSPEFSKALIHRGGLRARVLTGGEVRAGDAIVVLGRE